MKKSGVILLSLLIFFLKISVSFAYLYFSKDNSKNEVEFNFAAERRDGAS